MEVGVEIAVNTDSASSSASPEFQRENGDGDEEGWPLPVVVAARVENPDGAPVDLASDTPLPPADSERPLDSTAEVAQTTSPQRKRRPLRTLMIHCQVYEFD